jgi:hypothetical protein
LLLFCFLITFGLFAVQVKSDEQKHICHSFCNLKACNFWQWKRVWVVVKQERKRRTSMISGGNKVSRVCFLPMWFQKKIMNYGREKTIVFTPTCDTFETYHLMVVLGIIVRCIKVFSILYGYLWMHWSDKQWIATGWSCTLTHSHIPFRIFLPRKIWSWFCNTTRFFSYIAKDSYLYTLFLVHQT